MIIDVAMVGGGTYPHPGEISLAHNGVLFLDELPEFSRKTLEVLRQPLEDGMIQIDRARMKTSFPSKIMLIASMNPSPSGDWYQSSDSNGPSFRDMRRYLDKISGPLLDRIDIHIEVPKIKFDELSSKKLGEPSSNILSRVIEARERQKHRLQYIPNIYCNAQLNPKLTREHCSLNETGYALMRQAMDSLGLSARAYDRILRVARTIADLESSTNIMTAHIAEAIQYRHLDREGWLG